MANNGTFVEKSGAETGRPVQVFSGSLRLRGKGPSQFILAQENSSGTTSGNIAPDQVVRVLGMNGTGSFTGTIIEAMCSCR